MKAEEQEARKRNAELNQRLAEIHEQYPAHVQIIPANQVRAQLSPVPPNDDSVPI
jgi:hypothetical protein